MVVQSATGTRTLRFDARGGELLGKMLLGLLLCSITLGIYGPWFIASLFRFMAERTTFDARQGPVRFSFTTTGGDIFKAGLITALLNNVTLFIYTPWGIVRMLRCYLGGFRAQLPNGKPVRLELEVTGGQLLGEVLLGGFLCGITLGIYWPWFFCKLLRRLASSTHIVEGEERVGTLRFTATGGRLLVVMVPQLLLLTLSAFLYLPWFITRMARFYGFHYRVKYRDVEYSFDWLSTGGDLFKLLLVNGFFNSITLGIYGSWMFCNVLRFATGSTRAVVVEPNGALRTEAIVPAPLEARLSAAA